LVGVSTGNTEDDSEYEPVEESEDEEMDDETKDAEEEENTVETDEVGVNEEEINEDVDETETVSVAADPVDETEREDEARAADELVAADVWADDETLDAVEEDESDSDTEAEDEVPRVLDSNEYDIYSHSKGGCGN
jgi:hypothetical protein